MEDLIQLFEFERTLVIKLQNMLQTHINDKSKILIKSFYDDIDYDV